MKNFFIFILIIVVIILGFLLAKKSGVINGGVGQTSQENYASQENNQSSVEPKNLFASATEQTYKETTDTFEANIKYPTFGNTKIDNAIRDYILQDLSDFKAGNNIDTPNPVAQNTYDASYELHQSSETTGIIFNISDYTGGAHGNLRIKTLNYDNFSGQYISIGSLFIPGTDYLTRLSQITSSDLKSSLASNSPEEESWIDEGTAPVSQNFDSFYFEDDDTLVIVFEPYQVAPWAYGPQTVKINARADFSDILLNI